MYLHCNSRLQALSKSFRNWCCLEKLPQHVGQCHVCSTVLIHSPKKHLFPSKGKDVLQTAYSPLCPRMSWSSRSKSILIITCCWSVCSVSGSSSHTTASSSNAMKICLYRRGKNWRSKHNNSSFSQLQGKGRCEASPVAQGFCPRPTVHYPLEIKLSPVHMNAGKKPLLPFVLQTEVRFAVSLSS